MSVWPKRMQEAVKGTQMSFCAVAFFFFLSFFRLILAVRIGAIIQDLCVGLSEGQVTSRVVLAEVVKASWAALPGGGLQKGPTHR